MAQFDADDPKFADGASVAQIADCLRTAKETGLPWHALFGPTEPSAGHEVPTLRTQLPYCMVLTF